MILDAVQVVSLQVVHHQTMRVYITMNIINLLQFLYIHYSDSHITIEL